MQEKGLAVVKGQKRSIPTDYSALKRAELKQAIEKYIFGHLPPEVPEAEKKFLLELAFNLGLNPWKGEIHFLPFRDKKTGEMRVSPVVSYLIYIRRADQSGKLDGWEIDSDGKTAVCTIYRKDWSRPFKWTVTIEEARKDTRAWREMPIFMLKKVCIAQAFRLAFPAETGELPYTFEEVPIEEVVIEAEAKIMPESQLQSTSQPRPEEVPQAKETIKDPRVAQAKRLAEAKGIEMDAEPTDTEWVQLYSSGILTGRLAKGQKMSALLARLKKQTASQTQTAQEQEGESRQAEAKQSELLKK